MAQPTTIRHRDLKEAEKRYYAIRAEAEREETMITSTETITPALASIMLQRNPDNRKIKPATVDKYAADMKDGRWRTNGETIILAKDGNLNTGQHRLHAVIKSGVAIVMNLCRGAEREDRFTIDTGVVQSAGDKVSQKGIKYGSVVSSVAAIILSFRTSGHSNASRISKSEILDLIDNDKRVIEASEYAGANSTLFSRVNITKKIIGFLYYTLGEIDAVKATSFLDSLRTGASLSAHDPIFLLRSRLLSNNKFSEAAKLELAYRAWNAWYSGDKVGRLAVTGNLPKLEGYKDGK